MSAPLFEIGRCHGGLPYGGLQQRFPALAEPAAGISALDVPEALFCLAQLLPKLLGLLLQAGDIVFKDGGRLRRRADRSCS
ncbi:MAG: hypothetical protein Q7U75_01515, partial [Desulfobacterales bacterium]|nr:hypothetical protein [Desulfobacterales bacterium]